MSPALLLASIIADFTELVQLSFVWDRILAEKGTVEYTLEPFECFQLTILFFDMR